MSCGGFGLFGIGYAWVGYTEIYDFIFLLLLSMALHKPAI
jgi:hypothetical protein